MLEQKIEALTEEIAKLTKLLASGASVGGSSSTATAGKATGTAAGKAAAGKATGKTAGGAKSKHTRAEMQAALNEVKENFDTETAKALIKAAGFAKMADIPDDMIDEVYDAAKAKMAELEGGGDEGGGDDDI